MPPEMDKLPCGCEIGTAVVNGEKTMFYRPCSFTCRYYLYAMEQSRKQGSRIEARIEALDE